MNRRITRNPVTVFSRFSTLTLKHPSASVKPEIHGSFRVGSTGCLMIATLPFSTKHDSLFQASS